jgi:hypothetical protein
MLILLCLLALYFLVSSYRSLIGSDEEALRCQRRAAKNLANSRLIPSNKHLRSILLVGIIACVVLIAVGVIEEISVLKRG